MKKKMICQYIRSNETVFLMDKKGKSFSSLELASLFQKQMLNSINNMVFVIGGVNGLADSFFNDYKSISFGKQTWPHLLIRVMLIEQIYRTLQILKGHPYHK